MPSNLHPEALLSWVTTHKMVRVTHANKRYKLVARLSISSLYTGRGSESLAIRRAQYIMAHQHMDSFCRRLVLAKTDSKYLGSAFESSS